MATAHKDDKEEEVQYRRNPHYLETWEVQELREFIEEWKRYKWLWGFLGRVSAWIGGVVVAVWASRELISKVIKAITE